MSVFRNLDCLSLFVYSNTTLLELPTLLFLFFFQNLHFQIGGAAYLRMRLIHGHLWYFLPLDLCKHTSDLINIHIFDYPDSRLSGLFTKVPMSPDNRGSTVLNNSNYKQINCKLQ